LVSSSNLVQGIVAEAYDIWGKPWYARLLQYIGSRYRLNLLWNLGCWLNRRAQIRATPDASHIAYSIIYVISHAGEHGMSSVDKDFYENYQKWLES